jgi:hypothetical protein
MITELLGHELGAADRAEPLHGGADGGGNHVGVRGVGGLQRGGGQRLAPRVAGGLPHRRQGVLAGMGICFLC